jgi:hypothetical protein
MREFEDGASRTTEPDVYELIAYSDDVLAGWLAPPPCAASPAGIASAANKMVAIKVPVSCASYVLNRIFRQLSPLLDGAYFCRQGASPRFQPKRARMRAAASLAVTLLCCEAVVVWLINAGPF